MNNLRLIILILLTICEESLSFQKLFSFFDIRGVIGTILKISFLVENSGKNIYIYMIFILFWFFRIGFDSKSNIRLVLESK